MTGHSLLLNLFHIHDDPKNPTPHWADTLVLIEIGRVLFAMFPIILRPVIALGLPAYISVLPFIVFYGLGIYAGLWIGLLNGPVGYIVVYGVLCVPVLKWIGLVLLCLQSMHVSLKYIAGTYEPSLLGYLTMVPFTIFVLGFLIALIEREFLDR